MPIVSLLTLCQGAFRHHHSRIESKISIPHHYPTLPFVSSYHGASCFWFAITHEGNRRFRLSVTYNPSGPTYHRGYKTSCEEKDSNLFTFPISASEQGLNLPHS